MNKPNVILVNPSLSYDGGKYGEIVFPFAAIMLLATILDREGYEVKVIDGNRYDIQGSISEIIKEINDSTVFVGFSVMTSQVSWAYKVTAEVKKNYPRLKIIWGGVHPTLYPEQTISDELVDVVVVNEACSTVVALTKAVTQGGDLSGIPGLYFKLKGKIVKTVDFIPDDIKNIPEINFSLIDAAYYSRDNMLPRLYNLSENETISLPIVTGLGCAYKCTFCINVILNRKYRFRTAEEIVDRIEYLQKSYGANFFQFLDEDFFINKKRVFDFINLVENRGLKFYFRPWLRVSYFKDNYIALDVAKRLERIGMVTAVMGAECGSQAILDKIQKQIKVEDTVRAAEVLAKTNIIPKFSFMVGLPGETKRDILATYQLALKLKALNERTDIAILSFAAYPGSPIYSEAASKYKLEEPLSLAEWAKIDFSGYLGFYSVQDKPWIFNKEIFQRMGYYYNLGFRFTHKKGRMNDLLHELLRMIIKLRFKLGWFSFPFEDFFIRSRGLLKSQVGAEA